jgi:hypothetical protein
VRGTGAAVTVRANGGRSDGTTQRVQPGAHPDLGRNDSGGASGSCRTIQEYSPHHVVSRRRHVAVPRMRRPQRRKELPRSKLQSTRLPSSGAMKLCVGFPIGTRVCSRYIEGCFVLGGSAVRHYLRDTKKMRLFTRRLLQGIREGAASSKRALDSAADTNPKKRVAAAPS